MNKFKAAGTVLVLAAAPLVAAAAPSATASAQRCTSIIGPSAWGNTWFESQWQTNRCNEQERGIAECQDGRSLIMAKPGGWVRATLLWSRSTCPPNYVLKRGGYEQRTGPGYPITKHWVAGS